MQRTDMLSIFCLTTKVVGTQILTFLWIWLGLLTYSSNEVHTSDIYLWEQNQSWLLALSLINCWPVLSQLRNQDLPFSLLSLKLFFLLWSDPPFISEQQPHSPEPGLDVSPSYVFSCKHFHFVNFVSRGFSQKGEANASSVSITLLNFTLFKKTLIKKNERFK